jgi:hypothetical protein
MGTRGFYPRNKAAGREADHSSLISAKVKKGGTIDYLYTPICLNGIVLK